VTHIFVKLYGKLTKLFVNCSPDSENEPPVKKMKSENGSENTGIISDLTEEVKINTSRLIDNICLF
jgi:hypothetical protein